MRFWSSKHVDFTLEIAASTYGDGPFFDKVEGILKFAPSRFILSEKEVFIWSILVSMARFMSTGRFLRTWIKSFVALKISLGYCLVVFSFPSVFKRFFSLCYTTFGIDVGRI
jgi:hypothetical protein